MYVAMPQVPSNPTAFVSQEVANYIGQNKNQAMLADLDRALLSKRNKSPKAFLEDCVCNLNRHQWFIGLPRYSQTPGKAAAQILHKKVDRPGYKDFEALYDSVRMAIINEYGVGDCVVYDCSLRLGHTLGISPKDYVYVHARPLEVVKVLTPQLLSGHAPRIKRQALVNAFPSLANLNTSEIEDILCFMYPYLFP